MIVHCGATPVFADVREDTLNIDPARVARARQRAHQGDRARRPVRPAGRPRRADARSGCRWSRTRRTPPSRATAAARSARSRDLTCFSLYATKNIAAGEGGLIATNRDDLADGARRPARDAPRPRLALRHRRARLQGEPERRALVDRARPARQGRPARRDPASATSRSTTRASPTSRGSTPVARDERDVHANHLYVVRITFADRDEVQRALTEENIGTSIHFLPVHLLSAYRDRLAPNQPAAAGDRARGRRGALAAALAGAFGRRRARRGRRVPARPRAARRMKRSLRIAATLLVTGARRRLHPHQGRPRRRPGTSSARPVPWWIALSAFLTLVTVPPMAWRWQLLLAVRGVHERLLWLTRTYFVSYAVGQVLPTSVGGDASRIFETSRRHPGQITPITGSVLLERSLGGAVTLLLAGIGLLLAIGRYPIGPYLWIELLFVVGTIARRVRVLLALGAPAARLPAPARAAPPARDPCPGGLRRHPRLPRPPRNAVLRRR